MLRRKVSLAGTLIALLGAMVFFTNCSGADPQDGFSDTSEAEKVKAATTTATTNAACTAIAPFYWEVGNVNSVLASGSTGNGSVIRTSNMLIGSASKWLFGAYVLEEAGGAPATSDVPYLTMTAGFNSFGPFSCTSASTVLDCFNANNQLPSNVPNSTYTSGNVGKFYYNGGHFQSWGVNVGGLSSNTPAALTTKYRASLGSNTQITFTSTQLAGGAFMNASGYANFLRNIISGQLMIKNYLGEDAVCTLPSGSCNAISSPIPLAFHYSYGHWIEDDPTGDGAFSSAGIFGFYPWIDKTKKFYGVLARFQAYSDTSNEIGNGYASFLCGKLIRKAYMSGTAQ